jgi:hypothetical protein
LREFVPFADRSDEHAGIGTDADAGRTLLIGTKRNNGRTNFVGNTEKPSGIPKTRARRKSRRAREFRFRETERRFAP